jgi:hypothetical protein
LFLNSLTTQFSAAKEGYDRVVDTDLRGLGAISRAAKKTIPAHG